MIESISIPSAIFCKISVFMLFTLNCFVLSFLGIHTLLIVLLNLL